VATTTARAVQEPSGVVATHRPSMRSRRSRLLEVRCQTVVFGVLLEVVDDLQARGIARPGLGHPQPRKG